ncbi:hypothetical protein CFP56_025661 [Quercus suber]|uniref:Uncharacterized protein n=1 Tax=Quercus suber TaxID=58331 RepID=A0AAW0K3F4_QUESU
MIVGGFTPFGLDLLHLCFLHVVSSPSHHDSPDPVPETNPVPETKKSSKATYSKKTGDELGKTKAIASTGVKKVKEPLRHGAKEADVKQIQTA